MFPVSDRFLETIAGTHQAVVRARLLTSTQFGVDPQGAELPILDGDVKLAATADVKATLEITVPGDYWEQVQPYGAEIWVARGVAFGDGTQELVPLGYYRIDDVEQESAPYGPVRLSCSDRISQLRQNRVLYPFQVPENYTHRQLFERLVNGRLSTGGGTPPEQTQAAQLIHDRFVLGQSIAADWTWPGQPDLVTTYHAALVALWGGNNLMPAETEAALFIDNRILAHASINSDWTWAGMPPIVGTYNDDLVALWIAAGSPEPTVWLQDYITAHGGSMPDQTRAATIIRARLESGLTINSDWSWSDQPAVVGTYHQAIRNQYTGSVDDRPTAIAWIINYIANNGGGGPPDPVTWLEQYIAANGGYATINSLGYAAEIQGPAIPIVWNGYDPDRYFITGGPVVENSTYEFMAKLADARGCVLRFDELGRLVVDVRDPDPDSAPVYRIEPGKTGNLIKASRKSSRDGVYNIVVAYGSDPAAPTGYQLAYNNDRNSPLRWDGLFGAAPRYFASPLLRTPQAAADAAATVLSRYTGLPTTVGLWTLPNPAIRPQDAIAAKVTGLAETHIVDTVTVPLTISGAGPVEIVTRTLNEVVIPEQADDPGGSGGGTTAPTPAQIAQEKCFELTSTAENSTIQWWTQFSYLEDVHDGRGYTCGIFGATSATGDLLALVQQYVNTKPINNVLQPFLPGLQTCANAGMGSTASSLADANLGTAFKAAWAQAAVDPVFQTAQIHYRDQVYWAPAFNQATADTLSTLGLAIYYDTSINHGMGSPNENDGSFDDIYAAADVNANQAARLILIRMRSGQTLLEDWTWDGAPAVVGTYNDSLQAAWTAAGSPDAPTWLEKYWLTAFLSARSTVLTAWGDNPPDGRITMFTALLGTGNMTLTTPFSWSVYGDSYTMSTDPFPYGWTGGSGGGGTVTYPNPGVAHNIGSQPGQNSFNVGVGFDGDPTYGTTHHDFSRAEIEAGLIVPGYYELNAAQEVVMTCHPGGGKTSNNTNYSRVEYRELERDGVTKMAFNPSVGRHYVKGRSACDALAAPKPQMVLAQMHNSSDDTAMIYVNNPTTIIAKVNGTTIGTLDSAYVLGTLKDWMIEVVDGTINFYWGDLTTVKLSSNAFQGVTAGQYFKAGSYGQWNLSNGDATLGRVRLVNLEHWHSQTPLSPSPWPQPARPSTAPPPPPSGGGGGTGGGTGSGGFLAQVFVSTTGSDSNSGLSKTQAKRTLLAALDVANPGDTISVAPGTYYGSMDINTGGSNGNYITIRSEIPRAAIFSGDDSNSDQACFLLAAPYIRLQDLTITGELGSGLRVGVQSGEDNIEILNCHIHQIQKFTTEGTGWLGGGGLLVSSSNGRIDGNEIHDIGPDPGTEQLTHGIYTGGSNTNFWITNNLIYNCEDFGIHPYPTEDAFGVNIVNNTIAGCGRGILNGSDAIIRNNIVYNCLSDNYDIRGSGNTISNNFSGGSGNVSDDGISGGVDVKFVRYAIDGTGDFRLQSTSPCINAGTTQNAPARDFAGTPRPQGSGVDAGCFEYVVTSTPPPSTGGGSTGGGSTGGGSGSAADGVEAAKLLGWGAPLSDSDEFNYTGPPRSDLWSLYDGPGHAGNGTRDPEAFNVANGILTCTGTAGGSTGGMAHSRDQKYMRVEWRVRTYSINPSGSGNRYHPVLIDWPTSDEWPQGGEFDFYECDCDSGLYEAYLHIPGDDGSDQEYVSRPCDISQWHNIAFEWSRNGCAGWLDGQQVFNFPGFKQPPGPMHLTFQLDNFFGDGMEPARFEAMWCRIYAPPT